MTLDEGDDDAGRAVVARGRGAVPRLPGARRTRSWPRRPRPRRCSRSCCRGSSTRSPSRARSRSCSTTSTGCRAPRRARASPGSSTTRPSTLQLVLSTRVDPALPLGALRAHGQLLELRADELRFTEAEAEEFLNGRLGLGLAPADVELLVARTEGWPAGIYLAALSLAGKADKPGARPRLRRHERARRRLPLHRGARRLRAGAAGVHAAHVGARAAVRGAVRRGARAGRARPARWTRSRAPTCSWSRSTTAAAGSASTTCSPSCCVSSSSGASPGACRELHRRADEWHGASGTTEEAIHHALAAGAFARGRAS